MSSMSVDKAIDDRTHGHRARREHSDGGPNFLNTASGRILVAITITGDAVCRATNVVYRVDTASARQFLGAYDVLP
jgi:hypothetical protein